MRKILLVLILLCIGTGLLIAQDDVIYTDDFSENTVDWETSDDGNIFSGFVDGAYVVDETETDVGWIVAPGFTDWTQAPLFDAPYEVSVDVLEMNASINYMCAGLLTNVTQNYGNYMAFSICSEGRWMVAGTYGYLGGGTVDQCFVTPHNEPFRLTVQVWPDYYVLLLDGERIGVTHVPTGAGTGTVGLLVDPSYGGDTTTLNARFDNLEVRSLDAADQPTDLADQAFVPYAINPTRLFTSEDGLLTMFVPNSWDVFEIETGLFSVVSSVEAVTSFTEDERLAAGETILYLFVPEIADRRFENNASDLEAIARSFIEQQGGDATAPALKFAIGKNSAVAISIDAQNHVLVFTDTADRMVAGTVLTAPDELELMLPRMIPALATMGTDDPTAFFTGGNALALTQTYRDNARAFAFDYPENWFVQATLSGGITVHSQSCRQHANIQPGMAWVDIHYEPIATYAPQLNPDTATPAAALQSLVDGITAETENIGAIYVETVTIDGVEVAYIYGNTSNTITTVLALTDDQHVIELTLLTTLGEVQDFLPTVLQMAASARITAQ